jgi:uncharacterized protein (TIGR02466 family)
MQLIDKKMQMLFPTPMFSGKVSDLGACDRVEKKLREMQKSGQGLKHNFGDFAFLTADDIHTLPEMKELADMIMNESGQVLDLYKIKRDSHYITNMWANITHPNHRHHMHIHPNCLFSGIIYIKAPQNCGPTLFHDPRINARLIEPTYTEINTFNSAALTVPAEKGLMLIWPSYLAHGVEYGTSKDDEDRIVVAFNIMIRGTIDRRTARLELK